MNRAKLTDVKNDADNAEKYRNEKARTITAAGILFSNVRDRRVPELTRLRTAASIPFACRYRLIDFTLSNMVNSNIYNISLLTHSNYNSLMDHIGSGKEWDLARHSGGVKILPPFVTAYDNRTGYGYNTRLEALCGVGNILSKIKEEYLVLSDCDMITNLDLLKMIDAHIASGADMTVAVRSVMPEDSTDEETIIYRSDADGRICGVNVFPRGVTAAGDAGLNIWVMKTEYARRIVAEAASFGYRNLVQDVIVRNMRMDDYRIYRYDEYFATVSSFANYYRHSMEVLRSDKVRGELFGVRSRPIFTRVKNSPPTLYTSSSRVKNSLLADGCEIEGEVENCILFRGVKIGRGAVVRDSVIMQGTYIGCGASVTAAISDKEAVVRDGLMLSGCERAPYYIAKGEIL